MRHDTAFLARLFLLSAAPRRASMQSRLHNGRHARAHAQLTTRTMPRWPYDGEEIFRPEKSSIILDYFQDMGGAD